MATSPRSRDKICIQGKSGRGGEYGFRPVEAHKRTGGGNLATPEEESNQLRKVLEAIESNNSHWRLLRAIAAADTGKRDEEFHRLQKKAVQPTSARRPARGRDKRRHTATVKSRNENIIRKNAKKTKFRKGGQAVEELSGRGGEEVTYRKIHLQLYQHCGECSEGQLTGEKAIAKESRCTIVDRV